MAVSVTYSFDPIVPKTPVLGGTAGTNSDTVGLNGGGFATSITDPSGFSDIAFYNAAGLVVGTNCSFSSAGGRLAQLTNGNVVVVGTPSGGGLNYQIDTATGGTVASGGIVANSADTNADVAALTGGGFVVVNQRAFSSPDSDIRVYVRDAAGNAVTSFTVDLSNADDEHASVAGLNDGGFAVAFDRTDSSNGNTSLWYAVYNADGSTRKGPTELDSFGTINTHPSVTALKSGGFAIGYEDSGWDGTPQTTIALLEANGVFDGYVKGSSLSGDDSEVSMTTLSNGFVMQSFTDNFNNGGDLDIRGTLVDPTGGVALTDISNPLAIDFSNNVTSASSISATGLAQFAVSYTNASTGVVDVQKYQLVRTVTGTSAGDTFVGDDAVNRVVGGGGDDSLTGGNNGDSLNGGAGNDRLYGLGGNDVLFGGINDDYINGGANTDTASYAGISASVNVNLGVTGPQNTGGGGTDTLVSIENLVGGNGADTLTGAANRNQISGGSGDDLITGLGGGDRLTGNAGLDTFIYKTLADSGLTSATRDVITDFSTSQDKIDLSAIDSNTTVGGDQAFTFIGASPFSSAAGQLSVSHVGANTFVQGDVNGDKVKDFQIQFTGNISLSSASFAL